MSAACGNLWAGISTQTHPSGNCLWLFCPASERLYCHDCSRVPSLWTVPQCQQPSVDFLMVLHAKNEVQFRFCKSSDAPVCTLQEPDQAQDSEDPRRCYRAAEIQ